MGAGHDGVIADLSKQPGYGDANEVLMRLFWTDRIPSDPVVMRIPDNTVFDTTGKAFIKAPESSLGKTALSTLWGGVTKLGAQTATAYDVLAKYLDDLGLDEEALLGVRPAAAAAAKPPA